MEYTCRRAQKTKGSIPGAEATLSHESKCRWALVTLVEKIATEFHLITKNSKNSLPLSYVNGKDWGEAKRHVCIYSKCEWASKRVYRGMQVYKSGEALWGVAAEQQSCLFPQVINQARSRRLFPRRSSKYCWVRQFLRISAWHHGGKEICWVCVHWDARAGIPVQNTALQPHLSCSSIYL